MRVKILGSGGAVGVPVWSCSCGICEKARKGIWPRTRPSISIENENKMIIVDAGQDFRDQMIRENIRKIDLLLITHAHNDHIASLFETRLSDSAMVIAIPSQVYDSITINGRDLSIIHDRNPLVSLKRFSRMELWGVSIDTISVEHKKDYSKDQMATFGYLFEGDGKRLAYIPDANRILEEDKIRNLDLLIIDGSFLKEKMGHFGVEGSIKLYERFGPKRMILTHISHEIDHEKVNKGLEKEGNIELAYDGMEITL